MNRLFITAITPLNIRYPLAMENELIYTALLRLIKLQEETLSLLKERLSSGIPSPSINGLDSTKLLTRQEVQKFLNIGETTYKRKVQEGKLKPMKMPGGDRYAVKDLMEAFKESVNRGRV